MNRLAILLLSCALFTAAGQAQTYEQKIDAAMKRVDSVIAKGPYQANWASLEKFQVPAWYADAKFGIFIHWGVYSVPGFGNEWYPREMYLQDGKSKIFQQHVQKYGPQSKFGYKDFIPMFKAEKYDPQAWATLFKKSGARFVMPVAEHHDGFQMYGSDLSDWNAAKMGPKRDVVGDLAKEVRKQGMHFTASSHRAEHWWFFDGGMKFDSDVKDPKNLGLYGPAQPKRLPGAKQDNQPSEAHMKDWLARTTELVDKYQPEVIWFDWWIEEPAWQPYLQKFAAFYYNRGVEWKKGVAINYKNKSFPDKAAVLDIERGKLDATRPYVWQTDTSIGLKSWGYIDGEEFRTPDSLVDDIVDIVSKNGLLLLNIGPRPDGTIPDEAKNILLSIGKWLDTNGEAIYGTRPYKVFGEGPTQVLTGGFTDRKQKPFTGEDIRFTTKGSTLYAIALEWPGKTMTVKTIGADQKIKSVSLLGSNAKLKWSQTPQGLKVEMPDQKPGDFAFALKIQ
ncbi:alpha-L-fucosidase [Paludibaculum fermentans]|nr:alpha-L-fucosidase [Paludibaculum fermentans]